MKERTIQFKGQSPAQMLTIDAELRLMANQWRKFGVRMTIDSKTVPEQQLREAPSRKHGPRNGKPQALTRS